MRARSPAGTCARDLRIGHANMAAHRAEARLTTIQIGVASAAHRDAALHRGRALADLARRADHSGAHHSAHSIRQARKSHAAPRRIPAGAAHVAAGDARDTRLTRQVANLGRGAIRGTYATHRTAMARYARRSGTAGHSALTTIRVITLQVRAATRAKSCSTGTRRRIVERIAIDPEIPCFACVGVLGNIRRPVVQIALGKRRQARAECEGRTDEQSVSARSRVHVAREDRFENARASHAMKRYINRSPCASHIPSSSTLTIRHSLRARISIRCSRC
jgi:hypothetical protein